MSVVFTVNAISGGSVCHKFPLILFTISMAIVIVTGILMIAKTIILDVQEPPLSWQGSWQIICGARLQTQCPFHLPFCGPLDSPFSTPVQLPKIPTFLLKCKN